MVQFTESGYISPDGVFHGVECGQHHNFAADLLHIEYTTLSASGLQSDAEDRLDTMGWVKITRKQFHFAGKTKALCEATSMTDAQRCTVKAWAVAMKVPVVKFNGQLLFAEGL